jgi:hypothetical protein
MTGKLESGQEQKNAVPPAAAGGRKKKFVTLLAIL